MLILNLGIHLFKSYSYLKLVILSVFFRLLGHIDYFIFIHNLSNEHNIDIFIYIQYCYYYCYYN